MSFGQVLLPSSVLSLASVSIALYYNITFFGQALLVLPSFPVAAGCLFYYLSAFNTTPPVAQVVLWMVSFNVAGWLWWWTIGKLWSTRWGLNTDLPLLARRKLQLLPLIYVLPLPWLLWVHAQSVSGPSWVAFSKAILNRDGLYWSSQGSEVWLNVIYFLLATIETVATLGILRRVPQANWPILWRIVPLSGMGAMVLLCAMAQLAYVLH